jgi:DNA primase
MEYTRENQIKEIKERVNIVDIISGYVNLKKSGDNFVGLCPFHNEKTPSFTVNEKKGVFHCFGCGAGGDVISFLTRIRNEGFNDTVRYLANIAGVQLNDEKDSDKNRNNYYSINELLANYYHNLLFSDPSGKKAFKYLTVERGLSTKTINDYVIGYAPHTWDTAVSFLRAHNVPLNTAFDIGIIVKKQTGNDYFDRFRGRIMFPIKDYRGRIIAYGGRQFEGEEPKYLNSPDSDIYKKGMSLYGIDVAKSNINKTGYAIFVEGYMDVLIMHQYGFKNTVATTGTAVSLYHINTVSRFARDVVFLFDGDEAGEKAAIRTLEVMIDSDIEGKFALLPHGYDPDTFVIKYGSDAMNKLISDAGSLFEYYVKKALKDSQNNITGRLKAINTIIVLLKKIRGSPIKQELYIKKLAELSGVSESSIKDSFHAVERKSYGQNPVSAPAANKDIDRVELTLLTIIIDHPEKVHILLDDSIVDFFTNKDIAAVFKRIKDLYDSGIKDIKGFIFQQVNDEKQKAIISAAMLKDLSGEDVNVLYEYAVNKIKKSYYVTEQKRLSREIAKTKDSGNKETAHTLLKRKKEIAVFHKQ